MPVWNFRILVGDCETMLQTQIEESYFEKADWHLVADLPTVVLAIEVEIVPYF